MQKLFAISLCMRQKTLENQEFHYQETSNDMHIDVYPNYLPERSAPEEDYYFFSYNVSIQNLSPREIKLTHRHWIIRDGEKKERYINGEGVVGQRPTIRPGDTLEYQSFCPINTPTGNMRGKFQFIDNKGKTFWSVVPLFFFRTPDSFKN